MTRLQAARPAGI